MSGCFLALAPTLRETPIARTTAALARATRAKVEERSGNVGPECMDPSVTAKPASQGLRRLANQLAKENA
ncbi:hypothetical protein OKW40_007189 [Paraburkholderia sp. RAU6.4a]